MSSEWTNFEKKEYFQKVVRLGKSHPFWAKTRVVSRSHPEGFSGIRSVPGLDPTGSGSSRDSTGSPKFWNQPGRGRDGAGMIAGFGPKHDFVSINVKW